MRVLKIIFSLLMFCSGFNSFSVTAQTGTVASPLAKKILADKRLDTIVLKAKDLISKGFTAGSGYGEIWIRDLNTFINCSLDVGSPAAVKDKLLLFFKFQGDDGNIADGLIPKPKATAGYKYRYSTLDTNWAAHKNTVETDQETSLIQAVRKYMDKTNDRAFLTERIAGYTVLERMMKALKYLENDRMVKEYGLIKGATTIDWGDVQPETGWGVSINEKTKWAIDIYDNAMLLIALHDLLHLLDRKDLKRKELEQRAINLKQNIRKYLVSARKRYIPYC